MINDVSVYIEDADGPIQLTIMNETTGRGKRLLGSKGSPFKKTIKKFSLTKEKALELAKEIMEVANDAE